MCNSQCLLEQNECTRRFFNAGVLAILPKDPSLRVVDEAYLITWLHTCHYHILTISSRQWISVHCFSTSDSEGNLSKLCQTIHTFSLTLVNENHCFIFSLKVPVTLNIVSLYLSPTFWVGKELKCRYILERGKACYTEEVDLLHIDQNGTKHYRKLITRSQQVLRQSFWKT